MTYASLLRQTHRDLVWILADDLYNERKDVFLKQAHALETYHYLPDRIPGYYSNLPGIYNGMLDVAIEHGCDLAVSLQDYIWIDKYGIEMFVDLAEDHPDTLLTGLCSMLAEPPRSAVVDPEGLWTIFGSPYAGPRSNALIAWRDVRGEQHPEGISDCGVQHWEMNWAAIPLHTEPLPVFDYTYGEHIGHENQQFAAEWKRSGKQILIDTINHARSLPHRNYFVEEWGEQEAHRQINHARYDAEYGDE